jgi:uncharacterized protein (DUF2237 family)
MVVARAANTSVDGSSSTIAVIADERARDRRSHSRASRAAATELGEIWSGMPPSSQRNVLGLSLAPCSTTPVTGFFRTGCCETDEQDVGLHVVCAQMTEEFLAFSKQRGNDLSTPRPGFAGLRPGDRWCLCAARWKEALDADVAPPVILASTHEAATEIVDRAALFAHALDPQSLN